MTLRRGLLILGLLYALAGGRGAAFAGAPDLGHDAYVWQRHWTPALREALLGSADLVGRWHVLAAEMGAGGHLRPIDAEPASLAATGRPAVLVVRIDGQLTDWRQPTLLAEIADLLARWQSGPEPVVGLEIDHDCATSRLLTYAEFLQALHAQLQGRLPLSATVLATWLGSADLSPVVAAVDDTVLQVHAVLNPAAGLFDPGLARQWIDRFDARTAAPFRVALPAYGSSVTWDASGQVRSVESERRLLAGGAGATELTVPPAMVAGLLGDLDAHRPPHLAGIVWFRLPTRDDRRAWSLATWRAVVQGAPLTGRIQATAQKSTVAGMLDIQLENNGGTDASLPRRVTVAGTCLLGDGVNGYRLNRQGDAVQFERIDDGLLREQATRSIGWLRCDGDQVVLHVQP